MDLRNERDRSEGTAEIEEEKTDAQKKENKVVNYRDWLFSLLIIMVPRRRLFCGSNVSSIE